MYRVSVGRGEATNARKAALSMFERFTDRTWSPAHDTLR
jgi:hypothetical protein